MVAGTKHKPARTPARTPEQKEERNQRATHRAKSAGRRVQAAAGRRAAAARAIFRADQAAKARCTAQWHRRTNLPPLAATP
jgi:hypothetical protein